MHRRTTEAALAAANAIGPIDLGFVFAPSPGEVRGRGSWIQRPLGAAELEPLLPRAAAANSRGAAVYMRPSPTADGLRPGIVLLDDIDRETVLQMTRDGFEPRLAIETSPGNLQGWIALTTEAIEPTVAHEAARRLASAYGADPRAVAAAQPGRLPGFTNRKEEHRMSSGLFPFVRLHAVDGARIAARGEQLIREILESDTPPVTQAARARRAPEKDMQVYDINSSVAQRLDAIYAVGSSRIDREVAAGSRPLTAASASERDFALAIAALAADLSEAEIVMWLTRKRPDKAHGYGERTMAAAVRRRAQYSINSGILMPPRR